MKFARENQGQFRPTYALHTLFYFQPNLERSFFGGLGEKIVGSCHFFFPHFFFFQLNTPSTHFRFSFSHHPQNHPNQTYHKKQKMEKREVSFEFKRLTKGTNLVPLMNSKHTTRQRSMFEDRKKDMYNKFKNILFPTYHMLPTHGFRHLHLYSKRSSQRFNIQLVNTYIRFNTC